MSKKTIATIEEVRDKIIALGYSVDETLPPKNEIPLSEFRLEDHFGRDDARRIVPIESGDNVRPLVTLRDFERGHMSTAQREEVSAIFDFLREWKESRETRRSASAAIFGNPGLGKTMIAEAIHNSMIEVVFPYSVVDLNDLENALAPVSRSRFLTTSELMRQMSERTFSIETRTRLAPDGRSWQTHNEIDLIILDEVGEEGVIPFVKTDFQTQDAARLSYYFQFFDLLIKRGIGFFVTSNLTSDEFWQYFTDKTSSRIKGMIGDRFIFEIEHLEDYRPRLTGRTGS